MPKDGRLSTISLRIIRQHPLQSTLDDGRNPVIGKKSFFQRDHLISEAELNPVKRRSTDASVTGSLLRFAGRSDYRH